MTISSHNLALEEFEQLIFPSDPDSTSLKNREIIALSITAIAESAASDPDATVDTVLSYLRRLATLPPSTTLLAAEEVVAATTEAPSILVHALTTGAGVFHVPVGNPGAICCCALARLFGAGITLRTTEGPGAAATAVVGWAAAHAASAYDALLWARVAVATISRSEAGLVAAVGAFHGALDGILATLAGDAAQRSAAALVACVASLHLSLSPVKFADDQPSPREASLRLVETLVEFAGSGLRGAKGRVVVPVRSALRISILRAIANASTLLAGGQTQSGAAHGSAAHEAYAHVHNIVGRATAVAVRWVGEAKAGEKGAPLVDCAVQFAAEIGQNYSSSAAAGGGVAIANLTTLIMRGVTAAAAAARSPRRAALIDCLVRVSSVPAGARVSEPFVSSPAMDLLSVEHKLLETASEAELVRLADAVAAVGRQDAAYAGQILAFLTHASATAHSPKVRLPLRAAAARGRLVAARAAAVLCAGSAIGGAPFCSAQFGLRELNAPTGRLYGTLYGDQLLAIIECLVPAILASATAAAAAATADADDAGTCAGLGATLDGGAAAAGGPYDTFFTPPSTGVTASSPAWAVTAQLTNLPTEVATYDLAVVSACLEAFPAVLLSMSQLMSLRLQTVAHTVITAPHCPAALMASFTEMLRRSAVLAPIANYAPIVRIVAPALARPPVCASPARYNAMRGLLDLLVAAAAAAAAAAAEAARAAGAALYSSEARSVRIPDSVSAVEGGDDDDDFAAPPPLPAPQCGITLAAVDPNPGEMRSVMHSSPLAAGWPQLRLCQEAAAARWLASDGASTVRALALARALAAPEFRLLDCTSGLARQRMNMHIDEDGCSVFVPVRAKAGLGAGAGAGRGASTKTLKDISEELSAALTGDHSDDIDRLLEAYTKWIAHDVPPAAAALGALKRGHPVLADVLPVMIPASGITTLAELPLAAATSPQVAAAPTSAPITTDLDVLAAAVLAPLAHPAQAPAPAAGSFVPAGVPTVESDDSYCDSAEGLLAGWCGLPDSPLVEHVLVRFGLPVVSQAALAAALVQHLQTVGGAATDTSPSAAFVMPCEAAVIAALSSPAPRPWLRAAAAVVCRGGLAASAPGRALAQAWHVAAAGWTSLTAARLGLPRRSGQVLVSVARVSQLITTACELGNGLSLTTLGRDTYDDEWQSLMMLVATLSVLGDGISAAGIPLEDTESACGLNVAEPGTPASPATATGRMRRLGSVVAVPPAPTPVPVLSVSQDDTPLLAVNMIAEDLPDSSYSDFESGSESDSILIQEIAPPVTNPFPAATPTPTPGPASTPGPARSAPTYDEPPLRPPLSDFGPVDAPPPAPGHTAVAVLLTACCFAPAAAATATTATRMLGSETRARAADALAHVASAAAASLGCSFFFSDAFISAAAALGGVGRVVMGGAPLHHDTQLLLDKAAAVWLLRLAPAEDVAAAAAAATAAAAADRPLALLSHLFTTHGPGDEAVAFARSLSPQSAAPIAAVLACALDASLRRAAAAAGLSPFPPPPCTRPWDLPTAALSFAALHDRRTTSDLSPGTPGLDGLAVRALVALAAIARAHPAAADAVLPALAGAVLLLPAGAFTPLDAVMVLKALDVGPGTAADELVVASVTATRTAASTASVALDAAVAAAATHPSAAPACIAAVADDPPAWLVTAAAPAPAPAFGAAGDVLFEPAAVAALRAGQAGQAAMRGEYKLDAAATGRVLAMLVLSMCGSAREQSHSMWACLVDALETTPPGTPLHALAVAGRAAVARAASPSRAASQLSAVAAARSCIAAAVGATGELAAQVLAGLAAAAAADTQSAAPAARLAVVCTEMLRYCTLPIPPAPRPAPLWTTGIPALLLLTDALITNSSSEADICRIVTPLVSTPANAPDGTLDSATIAAAAVVAAVTAAAAPAPTMQRPVQALRALVRALAGAVPVTVIESALSTLLSEGDRAVFDAAAVCAVDLYGEYPLSRVRGHALPHIIADAASAGPGVVLALLTTLLEAGVAGAAEFSRQPPQAAETFLTQISASAPAPAPASAAPASAGLPAEHWASMAFGSVGAVKTGMKHLTSLITLARDGIAGFGAIPVDRIKERIVTLTTGVLASPSPAAVAVATSTVLSFAESTYAGTYIPSRTLEHLTQALITTTASTEPLADSVAAELTALLATLAPPVAAAAATASQQFALTANREDCLQTLATLSAALLAAPAGAPVEKLAHTACQLGQKLCIGGPGNAVEVLTTVACVEEGVSISAGVSTIISKFARTPATSTLALEFATDALSAVIDGMAPLHETPPAWEAGDLRAGAAGLFSAIFLYYAALPHGALVPPRLDRTVTTLALRAETVFTPAPPSQHTKTRKRVGARAAEYVEATGGVRNDGLANLVLKPIPPNTLVLRPVLGAVLDVRTVKNTGPVRAGDEVVETAATAAAAAASSLAVIAGDDAAPNLALVAQLAVAVSVSAPSPLAVPLFAAVVPRVRGRWSLGEDMQNMLVQVVRGWRGSAYGRSRLAAAAGLSTRAIIDG